MIRAEWLGCEGDGVDIVAIGVVGGGGRVDGERMRAGAKVDESDLQARIRASRGSGSAQTGQSKPSNTHCKGGFTFSKRLSGP